MKRYFLLLSKFLMFFIQIETRFSFSIFNLFLRHSIQKNKPNFILGLIDINDKIIM